MVFFRPERALSQLLRHDPFSPFITRSSIAPTLSRVFDSPSTHSPLCAPFITIFEDAPRYKRSHSPSTSSQSTDKSGDASTQSSSSSSSQMTRSDRSSDDWLERRFRRHLRGHRHNQPLSLWSPFNSPFPSLLNNFFTPFAPLAASLPSMPEMSLDMFSTPQSYTVHAAVPGLDKKDIKITVEDNILTIEAERKESRPSTSKSASQSTTDSQSTEQKSATDTAYTSSTPGSEAQSTSAATSTTSSSSSPAGGVDSSDDEVSFHHVESFYGRVERSVQLPEDAKVEELTAKYENGVIKIEIPRMQEVKKQGRKIEIQ